MDFYKQEIYGNILYTAYRTRSLVVSVSLLYSLFGVAAILYFADKGYAGIIAGVIIVGFSLWRINAVHQPVMLVTERHCWLPFPSGRCRWKKEHGRIGFIHRICRFPIRR